MSTRFTAVTPNRATRTTSPVNHNANYTFAAWVKISSLPSPSNALICLDVGQADERSTDSLLVQSGSSKLAIYATDPTGATQYYVEGSALSTGVWYHVALVRSGDNLTAYLNGVSDCSISAPVTGRAAATHMSVGAFHNNTYKDDWDGSFRGVGLWTAALSTSDILLVRANPASVAVPANIYSFTKFRDLSDTSDIGGSANDWTITGALTTDSSEPPISNAISRNVVAPTIIRPVAPPAPQVFGRPRRTNRRASACILVAPTVVRSIIPPAPQVFGVPRAATAAAISASDTAAVTESTAIDVLAAASDTATASDSASVVVNVSSSDAGAATDTAATSAATYRLFAGESGSSDSGDTTPISFSLEFNVAEACLLTHFHYWRASGSVPDSQVAALFVLGNSTPVTTETFVSSGTGWQTVALATPQLLTPGTTYFATVHFGGGHYSSTPNYWTTGAGASGRTVGSLSAPSDAAAVSGLGQMPFSFNVGSITYPYSAAYLGTNYWIDLTVQTLTQVPASDAGTGADASQVGAALSTTDSAAGGESSALVVAIASGDIGAGVDASSLATGANPSASDVAVGTESVLIVVTLVSGDTGASADVSLAGASAQASDSATSSESRALVASAATTDAGASADVSLIGAVLAANDSGTSGESSTLIAGLNIASIDAGTGNDAMAALVASFARADVAAATESVSLSASASVQDAASLIESVALAGSLTGSDAASATDTSVLTVSATLLDAGTGTEVASALAAQITTADAGTLVEVSQVSARASTSDSAIGTETASIQVFIASSDSGTFAEAVLIIIAGYISMTESQRYRTALDETQLRTTRLVERLVSQLRLGDEITR